jgi:release factor glutamine methyltransferase
LPKKLISDIILPIKAYRQQRFISGYTMNVSSIREILVWGTEKLSKEGIPTARLDAEVLLAYVLKKDRNWLYLESESEVNISDKAFYKALIDKRLKRVPVSYLTGHKEFMSLDFQVNANVLIPRPETELLIDTVSRLGNAESNVLELGTGSGAIAVSLAKYNPRWLIWATDISMDALLIARENAISHDVIGRISFIQTDLFAGIAVRAKFDWIISNPPYISADEFDSLPEEVKEYEPIVALNGGNDGLDVIRRMINEAFSFLKADGRLAIEIGYGQIDDVKKIADEVGKYSDYFVINDYADIPRIFCCQLKKQ